MKVARAIVEHFNSSTQAHQKLIDYQDNSIV